MEIMKKISKINLFIISTLLFIIVTVNFAFASRYTWVLDQKVGKWMAIEGENVKIENSIIYDDIDNDGIAYYYYIDENGYLLTDTICPDYYIVDKEGRRLDKYGKLQTKEIAIKDLSGGAATSLDKRIEEIHKQIEADRDGYVPENKSAKSEGVINTQVEDAFGPQLFIQANPNVGGGSQVMLGKGVVLKEKEQIFDDTIDNKCVSHIKESANFSKSVNGTTFNKSKWKGCMALKGTGAFVDIENPKNNFNRVTGRIATHYFTYSDRTTICTLYIYDDNNEEIYATSDFNYNSGAKFSVIFPRKSKTIRFELLVDGQYTTRVAYIRDLKFSFNRQAYMEEKEEDEENAIIESMAKEALNFQEGEIEEVDDSDLEAEDPDDEYIDDDEYQDPENDYIDPENVKASDDDLRSGPGFDKKLKKEAEKKKVYGPGFDPSQYADLDKDDEATASNAK